MHAQLEGTRGHKGACRVHTGPAGRQELGLQEAEGQEGAGEWRPQPEGWEWAVGCPTVRGARGGLTA